MELHSRMRLSSGHSSVVVLFTLDQLRCDGAIIAAQPRLSTTVAV